MSSVLSPEERVSRDNLVEPRKSKAGGFAKTFIYFLLLIGLIAGTIYGIKTKPELLGLSKVNSESAKENENLIARVSKIIELPQGETPTIATVTDLSKTQDTDFFRKAKEGDKVLVYQNAKKAYLYRPSENKIIEVGVVSVNTQGEVAGESNNNIQVITPTPIPTEAVDATSTPSLAPSPTTVFNPVSATPTITLAP